MRLGITLPQGFNHEYRGWRPDLAWKRTVELAQLAEQLGFESVWLSDHFHPFPDTTEDISFEPLVSTGAIASMTQRVRLGQMVLCAGYRNPALTAKMICTLDTMTRGRMDLGIGAGWKKDEWIAYGYGFPATSVRLAILRDHLEVITRMMAPGKSTYVGDHASVHEAINVPKPFQQPRIPIVVGGNGERVTWRLAARYADELNLDGLSPTQAARAFKIVAERCGEIGRDPNTLKISVLMWTDHVEAAGSQRIERLSQYREVGISRVIASGYAAVSNDDVLSSLAADAVGAGVELQIA